jgi:hypothetical protein
MRLGPCWILRGKSNFALITAASNATWALITNSIA